MLSRLLIESKLYQRFPEFSTEEGDQQRFWKLTRRFVDSLAESEPGRKIRIVIPPHPHPTLIHDCKVKTCSNKFTVLEWNRYSNFRITFHQWSQAVLCITYVHDHILQMQWWHGMYRAFITTFWTPSNPNQSSLVGPHTQGAQLHMIQSKTDNATGNTASPCHVTPPRHITLIFPDRLRHGCRKKSCPQVYLIWYWRDCHCNRPDPSVPKSRRHLWKV
jgi:hypothetical protein